MADQVDLETCRRLYVAASENPVGAKSAEEANRLVDGADRPTLITIPSGLLGRELLAAIRELDRRALIKGVVLHCDEADFVMTTTERRAAVETLSRGLARKGNQMTEDVARWAVVECAGCVHDFGGDLGIDPCRAGHLQDWRDGSHAGPFRFGCKDRSTSKPQPDAITR